MYRSSSSSNSVRAVISSPSSCAQSLIEDLGQPEIARARASAAEAERGRTGGSLRRMPCPALVTPSRSEAIREGMSAAILSAIMPPIETPTWRVRSAVGEGASDFRACARASARPRRASSEGTHDMHAAVLGPADEVEQLNDLARHAAGRVGPARRVRVARAGVVEDEDRVARVAPKVLDLQRREGAGQTTRTLAAEGERCRTWRCQLKEQFFMPMTRTTCSGPLPWIS